MIYLDGTTQRERLWGLTIVAHMVSDTSLAELKAFAEQLRLPHYLLKPFVVPHFELTDGWRRRALAAGAVDCAGPDRHGIYLEALRRFVRENPPAARRSA